MAGDDTILTAESTAWPPVSFPLSSTTTIGNRQVRTVTLPDDPCPVDPPPAMHHQRQLHYVPAMLSPRNVATIRDKLDSLQSSASSPADGATNVTNVFHERDTRCVVIVEDGEPQHSGDVLLDDLVDDLLPMLYDKICPVAQALCDNDDDRNQQNGNHKTLAIADALIRSYDPTETPPRNTLAPHYDLTNYCSVIVPLNDPSVEDIQGGLYVQSGASIATRQSIDFETMGDALLHTYSVMHGVHVERGKRLSLVIWLVLQDDDDDNDDQHVKAFDEAGVVVSSTTTSAVSWVERDARTSVHAAFLKGMHAQEKGGDAQHHFEWAAERGHALSQYWLSMMLTKGQKLTIPNERAADLLVRAATGSDGTTSGGLASAQYNLGIAVKNGYMGLERNAEVARSHFQRAAQQGCRRSHEILNDPSRWEQPLP